MPINTRRPAQRGQPPAQRSGGIGGRRTAPGKKPKRGPNDLGIETGDQGEVTIRISGKQDPAAQAAHRRTRVRNLAAADQAKALEAEAAAAAAPRRVRSRRPPPAAVAAEAQAPPAAPAGSTAPVRAPQQPVQPVGAPQGAPEAAADPDGVPVRVVRLTVDGKARGAVSATSLLHGQVFEPSGQDEHGQPLFQLRPEAAIAAAREVEVTVANDGPRAKIAIFVFSGDRMSAAEIELGSGIQATVTLKGAFQGHVELGYAPVQV